MAGLRRTLRLVLGFTLVLVLATAFAIQPVTAVTVEGIKIMQDVLPGTTFQFPMAVSIGPDALPSDYAIDVVGFGQSPGGSYSPLAAAVDTGPFSARSFVTVDSSLVHLDSGQRMAFNATIRVPENVGEGGRYALIHIHPTAVGGGEGALATAVIVPVMLTIKGTTLTHTGSITSIQAGEVLNREMIPIPIVRTTLRNTGNHHYYGVFVNVTVSDSTGRIVATPSTNPSLYALIPGNEMTYMVPVPDLAPATYTVKSEAKLADGMMLLDTKTVSIPIEIAAPTPGGVQHIPEMKEPGGATSAPSGTEGQNQIPFLPTSLPWPDALVTVGVVTAAILLWSGRKRS